MAVCRLSKQVYNGSGQVWLCAGGSNRESIPSLAHRIGSTPASTSVGTGHRVRIYFDRTARLQASSHLHRAVEVIVGKMMSFGAAL